MLTFILLSPASIVCGGRSVVHRRISAMVKVNEADPLVALRSLMASHSPPLDALIVPSEDNHQSEYVSARDKRREFVSGFTGSAGLALITMNDALLWTDGRYFLQATQQLNEQWKLMRIMEDPVVDTWIADNLRCDAAIGVDPWCISVDTAQRWKTSFSRRNQRLVKLSVNLVDQVWRDRPPPVIQPIIIQPLEFAGHSVSEKLRDLREKLMKENAFGIVIAALDEVAWLYNIRGSDVSYCPVVHAFAIVTLDSAFLYVDHKKVTAEVYAHLSENGIEVREYDKVALDLELFSNNQQRDHEHNAETTLNISRENARELEVSKFVWMDPTTCCFALSSKLPIHQLILQPSPVALAKSMKNPVELDGLRKAHIRDGVAVVQYLVWLDSQMQNVYEGADYFLEHERIVKQRAENLTEVTVSDKLESFRARQEHFKGLSFPTISSVGPNAAIIHYSPSPESCAELEADFIYLFDSGAQYQDGTTDITRTVHFGRPSAHEKACYTAVLKGHIALDTAIFPTGTTGHALDVLARVPLWKDGLDYRHGTGHGIGSYLNVHEGPQLISFRPQARNVPLQNSMTVTNEPGYYEDGNFGIRLENVLIVKEANTKFNFGGKGYLSFENITWVPFQKKLINSSLMTPKELEWLNIYHSRCREILSPYMNEHEAAWLARATEPVLS